MLLKGGVRLFFYYVLMSTAFACSSLWLHFVDKFAWGMRGDGSSSRIIPAHRLDMSRLLDAGKIGSFLILPFSKFLIRFKDVVLSVWRFRDVKGDQDILQEFQELWCSGWVRGPILLLLYVASFIVPGLYAQRAPFLARGVSFYGPRSPSAITGLDQAVSLSIGVVTLGFSMWSAVQSKYRQTAEEGTGPAV